MSDPSTTPLQSLSITHCWPWNSEHQGWQTYPETDRLPESAECSLLPWKFKPPFQASVQLRGTWPAPTVKNLCKESHGELVLYPTIALCSPAQLCVLAGKTDHSLAQDVWRQDALSNRWACNQGYDFLVQKLCRKISDFFLKYWKRSIFTAMPQGNTRWRHSKVCFWEICLSECA